jgi:2-polyprenyl-3-methyl-5-hydroxy-6-metoxy-1,4-benzoquinol methylase
MNQLAIQAEQRPPLSNPFLKSAPDALRTGCCGICHGDAFRKFIECRSLDSGFAPLYVCESCGGIYNATAEFNEMDVVEWQKRWAEDPDFYKVPTEEEFENTLAQTRTMFDFFENDTGEKFSGTYVEIGAGSGLTAASALDRFSEVHVLDHVHDRLLKVRDIMGHNYNVSDFESIRQIKADVVLIWHAMEHFLDPGGVFELSASILKPRGYFLMQVPILSEEHVYPGHYYFYSEPVFCTLAEKFGLDVHKFYYDHAMNAMTVALRQRA